MKALNQRIIFRGWIFWSCISGGLGLLSTLQEAKADVNFCLQVLGHSNSEPAFKDELSLYLTKFNGALNRWQLNPGAAGLKNLKDMSTELDHFIASCSQSPILSKTACQKSKKKLDSLLNPLSALCSPAQPWYRRFYSSLSSQISGYFTWIKEIFGFSKKVLNPLMLASCLGNESGIKAILSKDPKALDQKDRTGKTIFHYIPTELVNILYHSRTKADWVARCSTDLQLAVDYEIRQREVRYLELQTTLGNLAEKVRSIPKLTPNIEQRWMPLQIELAEKIKSFQDTVTSGMISKENSSDNINQLENQARALLREYQNLRKNRIQYCWDKIEKFRAITTSLHRILQKNIQQKTSKGRSLESIWNQFSEVTVVVTRFDSDVEVCQIADEAEALFQDAKEEIDALTQPRHQEPTGMTRSRTSQSSFRQAK